MPNQSTMDEVEATIATLAFFVITIVLSGFIYKGLEGSNPFLLDTEEENGKLYFND